jgi:hypothetical protein
VEHGMLLEEQLAGLLVLIGTEQFVTQFPLLFLANFAICLKSVLQISLLQV